ncbi:MAG: Hsp20/alpha crystallin family protein [Rikenellaceae bacterium]
MLPTKRHQSWLPSILNDLMGNEWIAKTSESSPAVNILECDEGYKVEIAVPGMSKNDFNELVITMEKDCNCKEGKGCGCTEKKKKTDETETTKPPCDEASCEEEDEKNSRYLRREFYYSRFQQTLILPDNIDKDKISAKEKNGILTIVIPKKPAGITVDSSKKIDVE